MRTGNRNPDVQHPAPPNMGEPQSVRDEADRVLYGQETQADPEAEAGM